MMRRNRTGLGLCIACLLMLTALLSGCTSARSSLGTSESSCYQALPTATHAVHGQGHLVGVDSLTLSSLHKVAPPFFASVSPERPGSARVCIVAFKGQFRASSVVRPRGRRSGELAVVVTSSPSNHLLGTYIVRRSPLSFGHTHFG